MRCAISLASASISCMVRLAVMLENTEVGITTPTAEQTSLTTVNNVMLRYLARPSLYRHAHQGLVADISLRSLAGVGVDELAKLRVRHVLELVLGPLGLVAQVL